MSEVFNERRAPMRHSAEPWTTEAFNEIECSTGEPDYSAMILAGDGESIIAQQMCDHDADRAAACVNALAGIPDPAAYVQAARGMAEALGAAPLRMKNESGQSFDARQTAWLRDYYNTALQAFRQATGNEA